MDFPSLCSWPGLPTSYLLSHQQCPEMGTRRPPAPVPNFRTALPAPSQAPHHPARAQGAMFRFWITHMGTRDPRIIYPNQVSREGSGTPLQYSCLENPVDRGAWWAAVHGVAGSRTRLSKFTFTFHFHALEKEMAAHSSVLAWRIPGMGKPGGLPSMGLHRVRHD